MLIYVKYGIAVEDLDVREGGQGLGLLPSPYQDKLNW